MRSFITDKVKFISRFSLMLLMLFYLSAYSNYFGQEKRPMTLIDLLEVPDLSDPQLSHDGKYIVYVFSKADWKANKTINHIWRINFDGSGLVQLTNGSEGENSPRWSQSGTHITFLAKRGEEKENQIYLLNHAGGEAVQLSKHATSPFNIRWSPNGMYIYFVASDPKSEDEKKKEKLKDDVYAFNENYKQNHLWRISVSDKKEERLTEGDFSVQSYNLSDDGKMIAFHKAITPLIDDGQKSEIWVMDSEGKNPLQITKNNASENGALLSPNNKNLLFTSSTNEKFEPYYNSNLFLVEADGSGLHMILKNMPYGINRACWSADGKKILFLANMGVRSELFEVDVATEKYTQLTKGDHAISNWNYIRQLDEHIFTIEGDSDPGEVWLLKAKPDTQPERVTHNYDFIGEKFLIPHQEAIQWKGADGVTVEGILTYPLNYKKGNAYPLVVNTHGGPASSSQFGFGNWSGYEQVLAGLGYAVLRPNYRGSTGYGDDFLRDMVGHYYNQAHLDVMTGVDHLIKLGIVDGNRMVKMGWSAGGHMTNKIITFTNRFKVASSGAGAVNWISMYAQSDTRVYRTPWFGGTPWQKNAPIENYWNNSPLKDIWKVKTPTLIFVGENDVRVPPPQSVELYRALKSNGVSTHLYIAPREPHGWRELHHRLFKMNAELEWFEKYAMEREYKWEKAPETESNKEK